MIGENLDEEAINALEEGVPKCSNRDHCKARPLLRVAANWGIHVVHVANDATPACLAQFDTLYAEGRQSARVKIHREDTNTYIAWIFENNQNENRAVMDSRIVTLEQLKQQIEFVPDFGPAEGSTASTTTWELSGSNPLRCESTEADPG